MIYLAIVYKHGARTPLAIANIRDTALLTAAARAAISEAEEQAASLAGHDAILGRLQTEEVAKLRRVLGALVASSCAAAV